MKIRSAILTLVVALAAFCPASAQELLTQPGESPLINLRLQFHTGAIHDPSDKEGLCYLAAYSLSEGSTERHSYQELLEIFYPWAVSVDTTVGKERVTFSTTVHRDHLDEVTPLLVEMMGRPAFAEKDLERLRDKAKNYLTQELRVNNDEELGKEVLYLQIYPESHPYGHHNVGSVRGLEAVDQTALKDFYTHHFTPANLTVAVAGGYPEGYPEKLAGLLKEALPSQSAIPEPVRVPHPASPAGRRVTIVEKDTRSVAMSIGFPIEVNRSHPDWTALFLFRSFFGEHRSSNSYLYQRLREARGLNYGDYAYIEYFPNGMHLMQPEPNYPRQEQIFQIWIRPVQPETAVFALRATLFELEKIARDGLTQEQFEATRSFLKKNAPLLVASSERRLGYALDSKFYATKPFVEKLRTELDRLTLEDVNKAIRKHIQADNLEIVLVTKSGVGLRKALLEGKPTPMTYNSDKPQSIKNEDKLIQSHPLNLDEVRVVPVNSFFRD